MNNNKSVYINFKILKHNKERYINAFFFFFKLK